MRFPLPSIATLKFLTFHRTTRHSLALGLARSIREPRLRGGYPLQLCKLIKAIGGGKLLAVLPHFK